jgi:hypothetical protein
MQLTLYTRKLNVLTFQLAAFYHLPRFSLFPLRSLGMYIVDTSLEEYEKLCKGHTRNTDGETDEA